MEEHYHINLSLNPFASSVSTSIYMLCIVIQSGNEGVDLKNKFQKVNMDFSNKKEKYIHFFNV